MGTCLTIAPLQKLITTTLNHYIMKAQGTTQLSKKTVFVYKNVKDQNGFQTDPSTVTAKTVLSTIEIFKK